MHSLLIDRPGSISVTTQEPVEPSPGEVVVWPRAVGLCGTDLELIDGIVDPAYVRYPLVLGHEWSGVLEDGTAVVGQGIVPCGHCPSCRRGATNLCETYDEIGFTRPGAASTQLVLPESLVHPLAAGVDFAAGALVEPMSVVLHGLQRANPRPGIRVLVVGDGTIGLLAAHLVHLWSPAEVSMIGRRPEQADLAKAAGTQAFHLESDQIKSDFDLVIEAAGAPAAVETAVGMVGRGGSLLLLGLAGHDRTAALRIDDVVNAEMTIIGSFGYTSRAFGETVSLLNSGRISPEFLITHRYSLTDADRAIEVLRGSTGPRGKVLLELPHS